MAEVVLHQWEISPFCRKVRTVLRIKGVDFRTVEYAGLRAASVRRLGAAGRLPVLDWDGERIEDSTSICAFVERRVPAPALVPADPRDAALARLLEDWADESLYFFEIRARALDPAAGARAVDALCAGRPRWERALVRRPFLRSLRARLDGHGFGRMPAERLDAAFAAHLDDLDAMLAGRRWLVGDARSIADVAVASQLAEIVRTHPRGEAAIGRPVLLDWMRRTEAA